MDIEKLIERLKIEAGTFEPNSFAQNMLMDAATALSTLWAENKRLKSLLGESGQDLWSKENQRADRLEAENKKLRAELEQVKQERDVAIEQLHGHCPACAHYTPNHNEGLCRFCCFEVARNTNVEINDNWEWRGQPAADVAEVRHGRWFFKYPNGWACSRCGEWGLMIDNRGIYKSSYCPNCGARMDKEDEHEAG